MENKNNFVLPFYHTKGIYIDNKINSYKKLITPNKKFKLIVKITQVFDHELLLNHEQILLVPH